MKNNQPASNTTKPETKSDEPKKPSLEAEEESAAAHQEPMGSVAAAVPGSDDLAQDAIETRELPGAESPEIRDQPKTTAGTETKVEGEEIARDDQARDKKH